MIDISQQEHERFIRGEIAQMKGYLKIIAIFVGIIAFAALAATFKYAW
jgi:hypothetical protein